MVRVLDAGAVTPVVPAQGSVGASGDLAPLAHMTAVMIGAGFAEYGGRILPGGEALAAAGLAPVPLGPKEGLAFINGTQFSTAFALAGLFGAWHAARSALVISAMSTDAIMGSTAPLQPEIHSLRGHAGQIEAAAVMRALLDGSVIRESHRIGDGGGGRDRARVGLSAHCFALALLARGCFCYAFVRLHGDHRNRSEI